MVFIIAVAGGIMDHTVCAPVSWRYQCKVWQWQENHQPSESHLYHKFNTLLYKEFPTVSDFISVTSSPLFAPRDQNQTYTRTYRYG